MLEQYGINDLVEGKDFFVEEKVKEDSYMIFIEHFFKDAQGNLQGYMKFHIDKKEGWCAYIIDTSSSSGFKHFPPEFQDLYIKNGYNKDGVIPWFWKVAFAYVLAYIKQNYPKVRVVPIAAYKKNEDAVWALIARVKNATVWLIHNLSGGSEMHMATIFLR